MSPAKVAPFAGRGVRAAGAVGPDEAVADLLESSAQRARTRAGPAAAAAALYRAATLTAVPDRRGRRLVAAAEATWIAGRPRENRSSRHRSSGLPSAACAASAS